MEKSFGQVTSKLHELALLHGFPLYAQFEITSRCNLKCNMCYVRGDITDTQLEDAELSARQLLDLAEQARDMGMVFVNITGGEPLIKKDFWEFYDGLCRLGLVVTLNTNGTTVTEEVAARLAKTPPNRVLVSLYGASEDVYEKVTGSANAYHLARKGVERLLEAGLSVHLRTTLVQDNYADYLKLCDWADSLDHDMYIVDYIAPRREGTGSRPEEVRMGLEQMEYIYKSVRRKSEERKLKNQKDKDDGGKPSPERVEAVADLLKPDDLSFWEKDALPEEDLKDLRPAFRCSAARSFLFISHDGVMIPCALLDEPAAHPLQTGLSAAWEQLKADSYTVPACGACHNCEHEKKCMRCPARIKLETGSFDRAKPDYLCGITGIFKKVFAV